MSKHKKTTTRFYPKKSLGQNFLTDKRIQQKIITACKFDCNDIVLEIGPGRGALTELLSQQVKKVIAVEHDKILADELKDRYTNTNVEIIDDDILKTSFLSLPPKLKVIGNLPYNIATPIVEKVIAHRTQCSKFYMTVQLEHGQRMVAKVNTKTYGSFTCFVQYYGDIKLLFKIKNTAFYPVPKVQSCFLEFDLYCKPPFEVKNEALLFQIIRQAFAQRRKNIHNSLADIDLINKKEIGKILDELKISKKLRAENLKIEDFVRITNELQTNYRPNP